MRWYHYIALLFGGAFLANSIPHSVSGITGHMFPTPFANPPGKGLSPPVINVLWGMFNLIVGFFLTWRVGKFDYRRNDNVLVVFAGALIMAVMLAQAFGQVFAAH